MLGSQEQRSHLHMGCYNVGVTVYKTVDWYRGEDSGAWYPEFGDYKVAEDYDLSPILDREYAPGITVREKCKEIKKYWPEHAGEHYTPSGVGDLLRYARNQKGVIKSKYHKEYGIIGLLPEIYSYIFYIGQNLYAVKNGSQFAVYHEGNELKENDFIYDNIIKLNDSYFLRSKGNKNELIQLNNGKVHNVFYGYIKSIIPFSLYIKEDVFSAHWPFFDLDETFFLHINGKVTIYNTQEGILIPNKIYENIRIVPGYYLVVKDNGKEGLVDVKGNVLIPFEYDEIDEDIHWHDNSSKREEIKIDSSTQSFYKVKSANKYGVVSVNGKTIIPCIYDEIHKDDCYFYIMNHNNSPISYSQFNFGVVKFDGKLIIPCEYTRIYNESECFIVEKNELYGCVNKDGETLINCKYSFIKPAGRYFIVRPKLCDYKYSYGIIDSEDNIIVELFYDDIKYLRKDTFRLSIEKKSVDITIGAEYPYSDTKALCKNLYKKKLILWGIFDSEGKQITPCIYKDIIYDENLNIFRVSTLEETKLNVKRNKKLWGLLDGEGKEICPTIYTKIEPFKDGLARVYFSRQKGFITKDGLLV